MNFSIKLYICQVDLSVNADVGLVYSIDKHERMSSPQPSEDIDRIRADYQTSFGQIVSVMFALPRYANVRVSDLMKQVMEPLARGRIVVAAPSHRVSRANLPGGVLGILVWANVSPTVDKKISLQVKQGKFPVDLEPDMLRI